MNELEEGAELRLDFRKLSRIAAAGCDVVPVAVQHADTGAVILVAYEWSKHVGLAVPTEGDPAEPRASQAHLEGLIGQLFASLEEAHYFHPPDRTPATKHTLRTILTKAGWSAREIQAMRGVIRALAEPGGRPRQP